MRLRQLTGWQYMTRMSFLHRFRFFCIESFELRDIIDPSLVENTISDNSSTKIRITKLKLKKLEYIISKQSQEIEYIVERTLSFCKFVLFLPPRQGTTSEEIGTLVYKI